MSDKICFRQKSSTLRFVCDVRELLHGFRQHIVSRNFI